MKTKSELNNAVLSFNAKTARYVSDARKAADKTASIAANEARHGSAALDPWAMAAANVADATAQTFAAVDIIVRGALDARVRGVCDNDRCEILRKTAYDITDVATQLLDTTKKILATAQSQIHHHVLLRREIDAIISYDDNGAPRTKLCYGADTGGELLDSLGGNAPSAEQRAWLLSNASALAEIDRRRDNLAEKSLAANNATNNAINANTNFGNNWDERLSAWGKALTVGEEALNDAKDN